MTLTWGAHVHERVTALMHCQIGECDQCRLRTMQILAGMMSAVLLANPIAYVGCPLHEGQVGIRAAIASGRVSAAYPDRVIVGEAAHVAAGVGPQCQVCCSRCQPLEGTFPASRPAPYVDSLPIQSFLVLPCTFVALRDAPLCLRRWRGVIGVL